MSLLRCRTHTNPHIVWGNSVQVCNTEVWLNHVVWGKQKPSGNYKRPGTSLLPGTCKFSSSFKLRAVRRMKDGSPCQGSCCSALHSSSELGATRSPSPLPDPTATGAENIRWTRWQKGGEKAVELILSSLRTPPLIYPNGVFLPSKLRDNETQEDLHATFPEEIIEYTLNYSGTIQMQIRHSTVLFIFCNILP